MTRCPAAAALFTLVLLAVVPSALAAQPASRFDVSISPLTITFPSADPDTAPAVSSAPVQITYRVRQHGGPWTLTVLAGGDLRSGLSSIDISNVSWTAAPAPPFENGTLSSTVARRVASGDGNVNPAAQGQITFHLANSWTYDAGVYTQTVVFTLSAP